MTEDTGQQKTALPHDLIFETEVQMSERIKSFRDLKVYKLAFELQQEIFGKSKGFPKEELYALTDQIRRSSRSIGSNIAEAWQKRRYEAHFVSKLSDSDGEQAETQHWLDTSYACAYISVDEHYYLMEKCKEIGRMLGGMMSNPETFCRQFK
jgi:four helix bundle protein